MSQFESQFEEDLYRARLDTLEKIVALGQQAYPNTFAYTHTVPALLPLGFNPDGTPKPAETLEAEHITAAVAGRIVAIRLQGKAGFATLLQGGQRLQIYVRKDDVGESAFALYKLLDLGDHIGVRGTLMRTRTGELTLKAAPVTLPGEETYPETETLAVRAAPITFLTKALLPLPDKHSGLGDIELRYRRRYLDLFTDTGDFAEPNVEPQNNPVILSEGAEPHPAPQPKDLHNPTPQQAPSPLSATEPVQPTQTRLPAREVFLKRAAILRSIRNFFDTRGYLEVETPMLHTIAGGAAARTFNTHHNAEDLELTLRIAPELFLKRLVVGGLDRVYEINRNFRNEGIDRTHNPEFTMLEFYQAYANYHDLMDLTEDLIKTVAIEVNGTTITTFNGIEIDLSKWTQLSMREAITAYWPTETGIRPSPATFNDWESFATSLSEGSEELTSFIDELEDRDRASELEKTRVAMISVLDKYTATQNLGSAIAMLFEELSEEHLIQPHIIYDFPLAVSPLSKVKPDEPDWVERFEFYIGGFEIGNAFSELNDPVDQRNRFLAQVEAKASGDAEAMAEVDEDYVRALGYGLPPTAGEGIGIDRLTMLLTGSRTIRDVILFPLMRPPNPTPDQPS